MKKTYLFTVLLILIGCFKTNAQNYNVDSTTKLVTNFDGRYTFNNVGLYDIDLKQYIESYATQTLVTISVGTEGTGRIAFLQYGGEKRVHIITKAYKRDNQFEFYWNSLNGAEHYYLLILKNNTVIQLQSSPSPNYTLMVWGF